MTKNASQKPNLTSKQLKLEDCYLYAISSPADLAARLNSSQEALESWSNNPKGYRNWTNDKGRKIQEPCDALQKIHGRVHQLLSRVEPPEYVHSTVRGRSYITNARAHVAPEPAVKLDVQKFFPSVTRGAVFRFFHQRMRCARDVAGLLARILTCDGRLATGSRASPMLAYFSYQDMFDELHCSANARGLKLTCYVDDITITGVGSRRFLTEARSIVAAHGLRSHKVKFFNPGQPRIVTGVVVTAYGLRLPNRRHRLIKQQYSALEASKSDQESIKILRQLISRVHEAAQIDRNAWIGKARTLEKLLAELTKPKVMQQRQVTTELDCLPPLSE